MREKASASGGTSAWLRKRLAHGSALLLGFSHADHRLSVETIFTVFQETQVRHTTICLGGALTLRDTHQAQVSQDKSFSETTGRKRKSRTAGRLRTPQLRLSWTSGASAGKHMDPLPHPQAVMAATYVRASRQSHDGPREPQAWFSSNLPYRVVALHIRLSRSPEVVETMETESKASLNSHPDSFLGKGKAGVAPNNRRPPPRES